jgi:uncharacterized repeat protein (TIGR03987 family)
VSPMVRAAVLLMIAALTFYSVGVWSERVSGRLKWWHLSFFWLGFVCDTVGTDLMWRLAGAFRPTFHGATGATALILMLLHASWATLVLLRRDERAIMTFHRISIVVWAIWLVPFVTGILLG